LRFLLPLRIAYDDSLTTRRGVDRPSGRCQYLGMASLADTLRVLNELETDGVIERYAVGGAMAMVFWAEPTLTFDLDVFVLLPEAPTLMVSLEPLYAALNSRGFEAVAEHVWIHGMPVQFIVSPNALSDEAIETAALRDIEGVAFRVIRPEYLCALWLQAGGAKRRERVEVLRQSGVLDEEALRRLLSTHGIVRERA
jgi:hypothetical protein